MNPRPEDIDALARAIDRVVFAQPDSGRGSEAESAAMSLVSYLNDSFPRMVLPAGRRERLQRRLIRALGIPASPSPAGWVRLEAEMNRRLGNLDPRWRPIAGGAALVLLGVLGFAVWRQRGAVKPAIASLR
ncbi:MAG TPA: hypothetical protein VG104_06695 [Candidatus Dormibacteraeota bacterium]|jgi:hypothetical protein|nr:hypothetical protein [Candidatus Dormibacteraeota bacterium]